MVKLYGGAIVAEIPTELLDASKFRPVPDSQECFVGRVNNQDVSLIVDLLEPIPEDSLTEALAAHAAEVHRLSNPLRIATVAVSTDHYNEHRVALRDDLVVTKEGKTLVVFCLFRLNQYKTDVLVCGIVQQPQDELPDEVVSDVSVARSVVRTFVETFTIKDPGLFNSQ